MGRSQAKGARTQTRDLQDPPSLFAASEIVASRDVASHPGFREKSEGKIQCGRQEKSVEFHVENPSRGPESSKIFACGALKSPTKH